MLSGRTAAAASATWPPAARWQASRFWSGMRPKEPQTGVGLRVFRVLTALRALRDFKGFKGFKSSRV